MGPKHADRMASSVDPEQTAPLFAQTCPKTEDRYSKWLNGPN